MKKLFLLGIVILMLVGLTSCGQADRMEASLTGYSSRCIDGVLYYQFTSGVTVAYNKDGTIRTCGK